MLIEMVRTLWRPVCVLSSAGLLANCTGGPTEASSQIPTPTAASVALEIVDVGTSSIAARLTNRSLDTLALAGCATIEEGRGATWVAVSSGGCALVDQFVLPAQSLRLGVPASLASSPVRVRVRVQTLRSDGQRSLGSLEVLASTR